MYLQKFDLVYSNEWDIWLTDNHMFLYSIDIAAVRVTVYANRLIRVLPFQITAAYSKRSNHSRSETRIDVYENMKNQIIYFV